MVYGLGFLFHGLTLVFNHTNDTVGKLFSPMIFLTGSLVGIESLGWIYQILHIALPLTWGISIMRSTLTQGANLVLLWQNGELVGLVIHSLVYLSIGLIVFAFGNRWARVKGTLAHY